MHVVATQLQSSFQLFLLQQNAIFFVCSFVASISYETLWKWGYSYITYSEYSKQWMFIIAKQFPLFFLLEIMFLLSLTLTQSLFHLI